MAASGLPPSTTAEAGQKLIDPYAGADEHIDYNIFLTDAFNDRAQLVSSAPTKGLGAAPMIDGMVNDDSYRQSRHLLLNTSPKDSSRSTARGEANLRENSLARQLSEKADRPATIRLIRRRRPEEMAGSGGELRMPWENLIPPNTKFFLEQVNESREEKVQVIDTFGEWVAFFFGRKPEVYSYSGTLLNAQNHDWKNEFQFNYDHYLRGSQAVKHRATMVLQYDDVMVEGYMMNCSISQSAAADKAVPFQFTLLVINRSSLNPLSALAQRFQRTDPTALENELFQTMANSLKATNDPEGTQNAETFLLLREYFSGNYIPPAGNISLVKEELPESSASVEPGVVAGVVSGVRERGRFTPTSSSALFAAQVALGTEGEVPGSF